MWKIGYFFKRAILRLMNVFFPSGRVGLDNKTTREVWLDSVLANITPGWRILDAGAGELQYKRFCKHLVYVSQDFARYDGKGNSSGLQTGKWDQSTLDIISDITDIPEPDASFDAIMCIEVLEHVPNPVKALFELYRLLKPGGILIVTTPFCSLTHFAPYFYQTGYGRSFYEYWFNDLGFEIIELKANGNYFEYVAQELRRLPGVAGRYTIGKLARYEKLVIRILLSTLYRLSRGDSGSNELLFYGLQVVARKENAMERHARINF